MYCPRCAAQSLDDAKFCRSCGADLKAVALALAGQNLPAKGGKDKAKRSKAEKSPEERRSKGARDAVEGATLIGGSLLICLAIHLLSDYPDRMALMGLWAVFFGWMACWGVFAIASGLGAIMQAASMGSKAALPQPADSPVKVPDTDPLADPAPSPLLSVTENTTRSLEPAPKEYAAKE
jgi:zinc ribbon protein